MSWLTTNILRRLGFKTISNSRNPETITFSSLFSREDVFSKEIFTTSRQVLAKTSIFGWDLTPYDVSENKFVIKPYSTQKGFVSLQPSTAMPVTGGSFTINHTRALDYISISFAGENMYASSWTFAYEAKVKLNGTYIGKIIENAGIFVSPMDASVTKEIKEKNQTSRSSVSGTIVNSAITHIDIFPTSKFTIEVYDVRFHGSLSSQGRFSITISGWAGGEDYGKEACDVGVFVFGS